MSIFGNENDPKRTPTSFIPRTGFFLTLRSPAVEVVRRGDRRGDEPLCPEGLGEDPWGATMGRGGPRPTTMAGRPRLIVVG